MNEAIGRIEILSDPLALARRAAEWMTDAALAAKGPFRVSLSGGSTPRTTARTSSPSRAKSADNTEGATMIGGVGTGTMVVWSDDVRCDVMATAPRPDRAFALRRPQPGL